MIRLTCEIEEQAEHALHIEINCRGVVKHTEREAATANEIYQAILENRATVQERDKTIWRTDIIQTFPTGGEQPKGEPTT